LQDCGRMQRDRLSCQHNQLIANGKSGIITPGSGVKGSEFYWHYRHDSARTDRDRTL